MDMKEFDKAVADLKAAFLLSDEHEFKAKALTSLFDALGRQRSHLPRPHFTNRERMRLCQELQIHMFAKEKYKCLACNKTTDSLLRCTGCDQVWFCSRTCQKKVWKSIHKKDCGNKKPAIVLKDRDRALESSVDCNPFGSFASFDNGLCLGVVRDKSTGRLFDSLTDRDIYFIPSEMNLLPSKTAFDSALNEAGRQVEDSFGLPRGALDDMFADSDFKKQIFEVAGKGAL